MLVNPFLANKACTYQTLNQAMSQLLGNVSWAFLQRCVVKLKVEIALHFLHLTFNVHLIGGQDMKQLIQEKQIQASH